MKINELKVIKEAAHAKRNYNFMVLSIMAFIITIVGSVIAEVLKAVLGQGLPIYISLVIFSLWISFGLMILFTVLHVKFIEKRSIRGMGFYREKMFVNYFKGALLGIIFMGIIVVLGVITGAYQVSINPITVSSLSIVFFILLGFVVQGAAEEVLVRGWMLPLLSNRYNVTAGIILSSLFFAGFHGLNPGMTWLAVINLTLYGLFAALYYLKEDSLWGIFAFHSFWNWAQGSLFGIKVSGSELPGGSILTTMGQDGLEILSGGNFGAEGGLIASAVLVTGIVYLFLQLKKEYEF